MMQKCAILYSTVSAQQRNLLPENDSQIDAIFAPKSLSQIYMTTTVMLYGFIYIHLLITV